MEDKLPVLTLEPEKVEEIDIELTETEIVEKESRRGSIIKWRRKTSTRILWKNWYYEYQSSTSIWSTCTI